MTKKLSPEDIAEMSEDCQCSCKELEQYKAWWERDSAALGKALNEVSSLRAGKEQFRAAIEQLHAAVKTAQELAATRLMEIERLQKDLRRANSALVRHGVQTDPTMNTHPSDEPGVCATCGGSDEVYQTGSSEPGPCPTCAVPGASRDASPADLVGALQDVVHTDPGPVRAGKAHRDAFSEFVCPNHGRVQQLTDSGDCPMCYQDRHAQRTGE